MVEKCWIDFDGMQSVSARDAILREIISNSLAHRDYSSGYVAKMIIEKDCILAENSNRTHGYGNLDLNTFQPFPKNPAISKVFREIGLADELGSGMRNTYKYTKMYSGGVPQFVEGDIFRTVIPLNDVATLKSGPKVSDQDSDQVSDQDNSIALEWEILKFCRKYSMLAFENSGNSLRKDLHRVGFECVSRWHW